MDGEDLAEVKLVKPRNRNENDIPPARSGHRIVVTPAAVYSIGGYNPAFWDEPNDNGTIYPLFNELWKFNLSTKKWKLLKTIGHTPKAMASHTALLVSNKLFVHGGTGTPFGAASSNQLHVCDLESLVWKHIVTTGEQPEPLYGHSLSLVNGSYLYMFGGTTGYQYRNSLHKLNLRNRSWSSQPRLHNSDVPGVRYRHECVADEKYLYVLGGGTSNHDYDFQKIDAFDLVKCRWEQLTCHGTSEETYPTPRRCHAAIRYKKGVYIIGGFNRVDVFDDIWRLDLDTLIWSCVRHLREPVYFHSADVTSHGCVYVYGGVNHIDDVRNSDLYRLWLDPPPLREQCWQAVCANLSKSDKMETIVHDLMEVGIPARFLERLQ